ncbi:hypothetical protein [Leifsonia sp. Leaf264]|uniref:hypothetical protein n=1 Tax=Leifsonia sp. Leaf264 TaxID=1736314 RepID=UPI0006F5614B|nr:hypothetical protein [Leifsonia sp. Leaf264]KQO98560.1 hypothetical protein ASF30_10890 [Leifsonia sp. Leaf264]
MTTIEQFRYAILSPAGRSNVGVTMTDEDATWIAADGERLHGAFTAWSSTRPAALAQAVPAFAAPPPSTPPVFRAPPQAVTAPPPAPDPVSAFCISLVGLVLAAVPFLALPLGIVGVVVARKSLSRMPAGAPRRALASWAFGLGVAAISITSALVLLAISGAISQSFW